MLEKAAANISVVTGVLTHERAKAMSNRARGGIDPAGGQSYSGAGDGVLCGVVCQGLVWQFERATLDICEATIHRLMLLLLLQLRP